MAKRKKYQEDKEGRNAVISLICVFGIVGLIVSIGGIDLGIFKHWGVGVSLMLLSVVTGIIYMFVRECQRSKCNYYATY